MHEQFQPLEPRRDDRLARRSKPQPKRPKGFILHEKDAQGLQERRIVPLMEEVQSEQLAVERLAQRIVRELSADRGRLREPEAALQNMLTRAIIQGRIGNPELFMRQVKEASLKLGKQVTQDVERIFIGIAANIAGIKRLVDEHRVERGAPFPEQFIGTNDRIDAADQIDLVDVRYRKSEEADVIGRVRLVQVKNRELNDMELAAIHRAHAGFHGRLAGTSEVERELRDREAGEGLKSGATYEAGMEAKSLEDLFAFERGYFGDFVLEYMSSAHEGPLDDETVSGWLGSMPMAVLKLRFRDERARAVFDDIVKSLTSSPEEIKAANKRFHELRVWAASNPPTLEDLREISPEPPVDLLKAASFESVVIHGSKVSTIDLGGGAGKGLTKK